MKVRESGMPDQNTWESYFDADVILMKLGLTPQHENVVEFGCGYGTFTIPAARRVAGTVHALDIDDSLIDIARRRAATAEIRNIEFRKRDFVAEGSGLPAESMDYAMLFNILHHDDSVGLLREARRNLRPGGLVGIIHWILDPDTPRGPPMSMRPRPGQCMRWAREAGFTVASEVIALPPYHFGLRVTRNAWSAIKRDPAVP